MKVPKQHRDYYTEQMVVTDIDGWDFLVQFDVEDEVVGTSTLRGVLFERHVNIKYFEILEMKRNSKKWFKVNTPFREKIAVCFKRKYSDDILEQLYSNVE